MTGMHEIVDLPDPAVQPLVHPLDLPGSRAAFRTGRLVAALTGPPVAVLAAAVAGYAAGNHVVPVLVLVSVAVPGYLASRWYTARAWDFIPRRRQDRDRPLPRTWDVASAAVLALVLGVALLLVVVRLGRTDVPLPVRSFTIGSAAVAALLVLADVAGGLTRPALRRRALAGIPGAVVVAVAVVAGWVRWFHGDVDTTALFWGALTMTVAAVVAGGVRLRERRRA